MQINISPKDFPKIEKVFRSHGVIPISIKLDRNSKTIPWNEFVENRNREVQEKWTETGVPQEVNSYINALESNIKENQRSRMTYYGGRANFSFGCFFISEAIYLSVFWISSIHWNRSQTPARFRFD